MKVNPAMFRAYDVRGVYGKDITPSVMERIGKAFAMIFVDGCCVVGMDGRSSGPLLKEAFVKGVLSAGKDVIDVGLVPRGACLFWAHEEKKASAYITASHLGKEWNGVKFAYENGIEFLEEDNYKIRDMVIAGDRKTVPSKGVKRAVESKTVLNEYGKYLLGRIKPAERPLKVVVDCGNGTAGLVVPDLFRKMGFRVDTLFEDVDGSFPNRPSEVNDSSLAELKKRVSGADIGVAYDGDSDRLAVMDEKGRLMGPELLSYIILEELTAEEKGPVIANVECLKVMDEIAKKFGREVHRVRVGNSFMVRAVIEKGACFGLEKSGHFCIPSIIPIDDGIAVSLFAASALSRMDKKLSGIVDEMPVHPFRRTKVDCPDDIKFKVIESLKEKLSGKYENVNTIDGVRIDFDYGWVLMRASNTGPLIRLSVEADSKEKLEELRDEFLGVLNHEIRNVSDTSKK